MKHARGDYDARIQDAAELIPTDEPVLLIRGQDRCALPAIEAWLDSARSLRVDPALIGAVEKQKLRIIGWQTINGSKVPDAPDDALTAATG